MAAYKMIIYFNDGKNPLTKNVDYGSNYVLKQDIVNIGIKGYIDENNEYIIYHPPHKIDKIEISSI